MKKILLALLFSISTAWAQGPSGPSPLIIGANPVIGAGAVECFYNNGGVLGSQACGSVTAANPTASVGLTAVNGVAATFMRSDAAPALASTIVAGGPTGSATVAPIITYNAAGQLTAVSSATITPAVGSITGLGTGVATALGNTAGGAGGFALVGTTPPTGTAGGDLAGTYPNPTLKTSISTAVAFSALGLTHVSDTTDSTSSTTGSLTTAGGLGVVKNIFGAGAMSLGGATLSNYGFAVANNVTNFSTIFMQNSHVSGYSGIDLYNSAGAFKASFGWANASAAAPFTSKAFFQVIAADFILANGASGTTTNLTSLNAGGLQLQSNGIQTSPSAATLQLGAVNAASPVAQALKVQDVVAGNANTAGVDWTFQGSLSNGSGLGGLMLFKISNSTAASGSQNTATTRFSIGPSGGRFPVVTVANLPTCDAANEGSNYGVSNALAPAFLVAVAGGGTVHTAVYCDGTSWVAL